MQFRFKAFGLHLLASAFVLSIVLGALYFGWYQWPGWYLTDVTHVVVVMICVDLVVGPTLTFVIAKSTKPSKELARDISLIALLQLAALGYGANSLWSGRPLYYAFSVSVLQLVQAYDIDADEAERARHENPSLAPHWYSLPRQVWAPLPTNDAERDKVVASAFGGGQDVISLPRYFKPWESGLTELRSWLKNVDSVAYFSPKEKISLKAIVKAHGFDPNAVRFMSLTGRGPPLLAVFDLNSMEIVSLLKGR